MTDADVVRTGRLRHRMADELRVLLARRRMTATELARQVGMKQPYLSRRMTGEIAFDLDDLERIASTLGLKVSALLDLAEREIAERNLADSVTFRYRSAAGHRVASAIPRPSDPHRTIRSETPSLVAA